MKEEKKSHSENLTEPPSAAPRRRRPRPARGTGAAAGGGAAPRRRPRGATRPRGLRTRAAFEVGSDDGLFLVVQSRKVKARVKGRNLHKEKKKKNSRRASERAKKRGRFHGARSVPSEIERAFFSRAYAVSLLSVRASATPSFRRKKTAKRGRRRRRRRAA